MFRAQEVRIWVRAGRVARVQLLQGLGLRRWQLGGVTVLTSGYKRLYSTLEPYDM